jgi:hypothetical protein
MGGGRPRRKYSIRKGKKDREKVEKESRNGV